MILTNLIKSILLYYKPIDRVYFRTRPEFWFRSAPVPVTRSGGIWAGTGSGWVPVDLAGTRLVQKFFYVVFRFYDELPASRAPSSSLAGSRAPLQFPD